MTHDNQRIEHEAAAWAVRLQTHTISAGERSELDRWLEQSPRHAGALLRARAVWTDIDRLAALRGGGRESRSPMRPTRTRLTALAGAASVLLVLLGSVTWYFWQKPMHYTTAVGALDSVRLADGSRVTLNTDTSIHVRMEPEERHVQLDRGEALFQVAKDASRPFIVRAGSVSVRAVGTAFHVRTAQGRVDVTVTEGVVELRDDSPSSDGLIRRIAANERVTVIEKRQVEVQRVTLDAARQQLAWLDGMIDFNGQSLASAVQEINRHNTRHVVIDDPALGARPIVGVFRANDPHGFAMTVAAALEAESVDQADAIHLRPRPTP